MTPFALTGRRRPRCKKSKCSEIGRLPRAQAPQETDNIRHLVLEMLQPSVFARMNLALRVKQVRQIDCIASSWGISPDPPVHVDCPYQLRIDVITLFFLVLPHWHAFCAVHHGEGLSWHRFSASLWGMRWCACGDGWGKFTAHHGALT